MTLPRLELTENPNKNNDFIIFRHSMKGKSNSVTKKRIHRKKHKTKKRKHKKSKKGFFNIFT
jgi:hypothetical protein